MRPTVHLRFLGCRVNEAEQEAWARAFGRSGWGVVDAARDAQVVIVNTCAVTREATRKSRQAIYRLRRENPDARLIATGCYAELEPDRVGGLEGVNLVVPNGEKDALAARVVEELGSRPPKPLPVARPRRARAFVKVQDGCRNRCTFCIVTVARGEERSVPKGGVCETVDALHAAGHQEVVLTGIHLAGYGSDLGSTLLDLVRTVLRETRIPRLRLSSLEPWDLQPELWSLWGDPRLMPHLHLPLQSGSDSVLRRMARRCPTADYARVVSAARAAIPDLTVTTDVIAGFPGETTAEWTETLAFVQAMSFSDVHVFPWSPREGTAAARFDDRVAPEVQRARALELTELARQSRRKALARQVGQRRSVLWEGTGRRTPDGWVWQGYTDTYLRAETRIPEPTDLRGRIDPVTCLGPGPDGLSLQVRLMNDTMNAS